MSSSSQMQTPTTTTTTTTNTSINSLVQMNNQKYFASKWFTLILSQLVMVSSGALYCFPLYSQTLKERLNLTQEQLTLIGTCGNFGAFFSVLGGMYFDKYGSKSALFLGGLCKLTGFGMTALILRGIVFPQTVFFCCVAAYIMGTGCSASLTASLGANYANFPDKTQHGRLVGIIMAFFGLSSGVFSIVYDVFFMNDSYTTQSDLGKNSVAFVQFLTVFTGGIDILCSLVVGIPKGLALPENFVLDETSSSSASSASLMDNNRNVGLAEDMKRAFITGSLSPDDRLRWSLTITAIGAVHVALSGYLAHQFGSQATSPFALFIFICIAYALFRVTTLGTKTLLHNKSELIAASSVSSEQQHNNNNNKDTTEMREMHMGSDNDIENQSQQQKKKTDLSPMEVLQEMNFYLLFVALMFSLGSGVTVINNLTQIAKSFGDNLPSSMPLTLLKMFACTNTLGRLHAGYWSDKLSRKPIGKESNTARKSRNSSSSNFFSNLFSFDTSARIGRVRFTSFLIIGALFGMIACWLASEEMPSSILALMLTTGCAITGWFYGALFWSMPTVTIDVFGSKHFGANRGLVGLAPAVGGYLMSTKIAGAVYQYSAVYDEGWKCTAGRVCYANAFFINTILVLIGYVSVILLAKRRGE